jgi:hypothetical protein
MERQQLEQVAEAERLIIVLLPQQLRARVVLAEAVTQLQVQVVMAQLTPEVVVEDLVTMADLEQVDRVDLEL